LERRNLELGVSSTPNERAKLFSNDRRKNFRWNIGLPLFALAILAAVSVQPVTGILAFFAVAALVAAALAAVYHAEVVALRIGEPFGTLVLALAVTVIEVALIVQMMVTAGSDHYGLARDTVFATVMIVCNGGIGLCLTIGALRHFVLVFRVEGTSPALAVLIALTTLTLILPTLTSTTPGPTFSPSQLIFAAITSIVLYATFVFVQSVRHRDYFLPTTGSNENQHVSPPAGRTALISLLLLCVVLVAVVGLAKSIAPLAHNVGNRMPAPQAVIGVVIALLVLMPETLAAVRAAMRNRMQTSLNLLTTLAGGRATVLHGAVHLVLFATFVFLTIVP
jgi:Ca2+:H+ antiporter